MGQLRPDVRVWFNPQLESRVFMIPGVLALVLLVITTMLTSMAIVREKEMGTMEMLLVSPLRPSQIVVGKVAPYVLLGFLDVVLVLGASQLLFRVPLRGSVPLLIQS